MTTQLQPALTLRSRPLLVTVKLKRLEAGRCSTADAGLTAWRCSPLHPDVFCGRFCATLIVWVTGTRAVHPVLPGWSTALRRDRVSDVDHKQSVSVDTSVFFALVVVVFWEMTHCRRPLSTLISQRLWCLVFLRRHVGVCLLHVSFALQAGRNFHNKSHQCCFLDSSSSPVCSEI